MSRDEILQYASARSRCKARQLIGSYGFRECDAEDIQQELLFDVLRRLPKFNGRRAGVRTFISRLIDHRAAGLVSQQHAPRRDVRRCNCSLDDWVRSDNGWSRRGASDEACFRRPCPNAPAMTDEAIADLTMDVTDAVAALPRRLRTLCRRLQTDTVAQIARETGACRQSLYGPIGEIRERFTAAGLAVYI